MLTTGIKQLIFNPGQFNTIISEDGKIRLCEDLEFYPSDVDSFTARRYRAGRPGYMKVVLPDFVKKGISSDLTTGHPCTKGVGLHIEVYTERSPAEYARYDMENGDTYDFHIDVKSGDSDEVILAKFADLIDQEEFFEGTPSFTYRISNGYLEFETKSEKDGFLVDRTYMQVEGKKKFIPQTDSSISLGNATLVSNGTLTFDSAIPVSLATGDSIIFGGAMETILDISSSTVITISTTSVTAGVGEAHLHCVNTQQLYAGSHLEEDIKLGTQENYNPYAVDYRAPVINAGYSVFQLTVNNNVDKPGYRPHPNLGSALSINTETPRSQFSYNIFVAENEIASTLDFINGIKDVTGSLYDSDGTTVNTGEAFIATAKDKIIRQIS